MPEGQFAEIVIPAEDGVQARFIRRWLRGWIKHLSRHSIREVTPPAGRGAGEQYVRTQFPIEADRHRRNYRNRGSILIAVIDADTGVHHRQLLENAIEKRNVFVFVPKRNIETWLHQLGGNAADEIEDYKPRYVKDPGTAINLAVKAVLEFMGSPSRVHDHLVPSLVAGIRTARMVPTTHQPVQR